MEDCNPTLTCIQSSEGRGGERQGGRAQRALEGVLVEGGCCSCCCWGARMARPDPIWRFLCGGGGGKGVWGELEACPSKRMRHVWCARGRTSAAGWPQTERAPAHPHIHTPTYMHKRTQQAQARPTCACARLALSARLSPIGLCAARLAVAEVVDAAAEVAVLLLALQLVLRLLLAVAMEGRGELCFWSAPRAACAPLLSTNAAPPAAPGSTLPSVGNRKLRCGGGGSDVGGGSSALMCGSGSALAQAPPVLTQQPAPHARRPTHREHAVHLAHEPDRDGRGVQQRVRRAQRHCAGKGEEPACGAGVAVVVVVACVRGCGGGRISADCA